MTGHTEGPIHFVANGDANSYALRDQSGNWCMALLLNGEQMTAKQEANLKRIEKCWNNHDALMLALKNLLSMPDFDATTATSLTRRDAKRSARVALLLAGAA